MRKLVLSVVVSTSFLIAFPATADEGRYQLEKSGEGYVRLDTLTGEMSICTQRNSQLVCRLAAEERAAFQTEIDRLDKSVTELRNRIISLENTRDNPPNKLPSDKEFNRTLGFMEQFMRRFMDIIEDFDRAPGSDKTTVDRT